jgi:hypothetical protein
MPAGEGGGHGVPRVPVSLTESPSMSLREDFDTFYRHFPRHVGKLAAEKAYVKARKRASAQVILEGVDTYKRTKPAYADWCMPATFLNQGRWMDEPDQPTRTEWICPHTPPCLARHACHILQVCGR